jgi:hypothetical protein
MNIYIAKVQVDDPVAGYPYLKEFKFLTMEQLTCFEEGIKPIEGVEFLGWEESELDSWVSAVEEVAALAKHMI